MKRIELKNSNYKKIYYYDTKETKISSEYYYNSNRKLHRLNGPASIVYYKSGEIDREQYCVNNKLHRINGPAYIEHNESGKIRGEGYWINNKHYLKEEFYKHPEVIKFKNIERNLKLLNKK